MDGRNRTYAGSSEFEALLLAVDKATSNTLFQPDWEVNRVCVEGLNLIGKPEVAYEIGEELQKKLKAPESRVVILTLHLIDSFVNECGQKWHVVMNDKGLCDEIVRMALRYLGKGGSENVAVVDACSDLVQSWGEAFLPHRKQYPNIVEMYISLRNVGFPFKSMHQHDIHHAPGYHPPANFHRAPATDADAALAASLQASLNVESARERSRDSPAHIRGYDSPARLPDVSAKSRQGSVGARHYAESPSSRTDTPTGGASGRSARPSATRPPVPAPTTSGPVNPRELMESLLSAANLLRDLIRAATTSEEICRNELAADIAAQIQTNQCKINIAVDQCMNDGQLVERLFRVNDDSQSLVIVYQEIRNGRVTLQQGKQKLNLGGGGSGGGIATATGGVSSDGSSHRGSGTPQRMVPNGGGGHHGPPPTIHVPPPAASVVQQQAPRPPPPQQSPTTIRKKGHRTDSLEGDLTVITAEPDPFAPQAIDALFDTKPTTNQRNSSKHTSPTNYQHGHQATATAGGGGPPPSPGHPLPPPEIPAKALKNIDSDLQSLDGTVIAAAEDPFAPEALDALFVKKPNPAAPAGQGHYHPQHQHQQQAHHHHHVPYPTQYPNQAIPVPIPPGYAYPGHQQHPMAHHYPVPVGVQPIQRQQQQAAVPAMPYAVSNGAVVGYPYGQQPMTSPNHHPAHHAQIAQPQMTLQVQVPPSAGGSTRNHTAPNSTTGSPTQHSQQQQQQQGQQQQQQGGKGFDPFSPAALDALFTGPTVTPASHRDHHHPPPSPATGGYPAQLPPPSGGGGGGAHHRVTHLQQEDHHSHRGSGANSGRNSPARFMNNNTADGPSGPGTGSNKVDPFSPEALDAMLGLKPTPGPGIADPRVNRPSHPTSHAGSRSHSPRTGERVGTPVANTTGHTPAGTRDPFSPEALDALFDAPSSVKSAPTPGRQQHGVPPPQSGHGHYHGGAPPQQTISSQQYHTHHASPQISPHGGNAAHYFPNGAGAVPAVPMPPMGGMAMPPPGMMYVAGPNGMVYAAPANVPPPPGYYPLQTYPMVSPTNTNNMPSVPHPVHHS